MGTKKRWQFAVLAVLLIGIVFWFVFNFTGSSKTYVFSDEDSLYWFELSSRGDKVDGEFFQWELIQEVGQVPFLEKKEASVTGEKTEEGYTIKVDMDGEKLAFDIKYSGEDLLVSNQAEEGVNLYKPVEKESLTDYQNAINAQYEEAIYHAEYKENQRLRNFFDAFNAAYGYLHIAADGEFLVFLQIDEAHLEGEVMGSLQVIEQTGDTNSPFKETEYPVNGITDGLILRLYTDIDGESMKLEGEFIEPAESFELTFWKSSEKIRFDVVTEEEYKKLSEEFIANSEEVD